VALVGRPVFLEVKRADSYRASSATTFKNMTKLQLMLHGAVNLDDLRGVLEFE